jgi:hypothetical protein
VFKAPRKSLQPLPSLPYTLPRWGREEGLRMQTQLCWLSIYSKPTWVSYCTAAQSTVNLPEGFHITRFSKVEPKIKFFKKIKFL